MFIPFLGAVIFAKSLGDNALAEARVGLAGPILGTIGAAAVAVVGELTGSSLLIALAYVGFFLNLFNLLPVVPLDGGRAMAAMARGCGSAASACWWRWRSLIPATRSS
jgi:Zn-dependent protease